MKSAAEAFEDWAASPLHKKLNLRSQGIYRNIWANWVAWLASTPWTEAQPQQVSAYLASISPIAQSRKAASTTLSASPVTMRRYWRVLRRIYGHAVAQQWCAHNPCNQEVAVPRNEAMPSMILPSWALSAALRGVLNEHARTPASEWRALRNQALLITLLYTGAKTAELRELRADQITLVQSGELEHYVLSITGKKSVQGRQISIMDPPACAVIKAWLIARPQVPMASPVLFFSAKTAVIQGQRLRSRLSAKSIFLEVSNCLQRHLPANSFEGALAHAGADTVRNSLLAAWLFDGMPAHEVMRRAGLAEESLLARLVRSGSP